MLRAEGKSPLSYPEFLAMCKTSVGERKYAQLEALTLSDDRGPLLGEWSKFYRACRRELGALRRKRHGRPASDAADGALSGAIAAAIANKDPLEAENALLALQFQKVDELIGNHLFDDCALMGYALKLKLLERKDVFEQGSGRAELERILGGLEEQILLGEGE